MLLPMGYLKLNRIFLVFLLIFFSVGCIFSGEDEPANGNDNENLTNSTVEPQEENVTITSEIDIGRFSLTGDEICTLDGKPIFFLFGSTTCPHCRWEKDLLKNETIPKFEDYVVFRLFEMDVQEVSPYERDIYKKYSTGYIPLAVVGCKYSSAGSGESIGAVNETLLLERLICDVIEGQKPEACFS